MNNAMFESRIASAGLRRSFSISPCHTAVAVLAGLLLTACQERTGSPRASIDPAPLQFSGAASCSTCHDALYQAWQSSHHALAMQEATPDTVLGDFSGVEFSYFSTKSSFFTREGAYFVRTENADGETQEFPIRYTFGVAPLQQYLVALPRGHLQPLTIAWDARTKEQGGQRWFHLYPDEFIAHDDPLHWTGRELNWNYMCAECHSTDLQKNYDLASDSFSTTWSEINVGCEACHGPASRHVALMQSGATGQGTGLLTQLDDAGRATWQMNTGTGIAERSEPRMRPPVQPEACGRCHSRRSVLTETYEYQQPLMDTHLPSLLDADLYYPDGQILEEVYVYGSFLQSRMYQSGVSCGDCHDPHSARLKTGGSPSEICSTCHLPQRFAARSHHNHDDRAVECVDCHMPARIYMGVDARRDHSFRIPRPDVTLATDSPNACNDCHSDRDAHWAASVVNDWYGDDQPAHFSTAIHASRSGAIGANKLLVEAIENQSVSGLVRGTALAELRGPYSSQVAMSVRDALANADPFVRLGALRALPAVQPELRVQWGGPLLADPLRAVRIEAANVLAGHRDILPLQYDAAYRAAETELIDSLRAIEERPEAHMNLGNHYVSVGDVASAELEFKTALRLDARSIGARVNLADLYRQLDRDDEAETVIRDGLAIMTDQSALAALHYSLGLLLVRKDQQEPALEQFRSASEMQPEDPRFIYVYGVALNSVGQAEQAIEILSVAAKKFPADFDIQWGLVTMLRDHGRDEDAQDIAARMLERYPDIDSVQSLVRSLQ